MMVYALVITATILTVLIHLHITHVTPLQPDVDSEKESVLDNIRSSTSVSPGVISTELLTPEWIVGMGDFGGLSTSTINYLCLARCKASCTDKYGNGLTNVGSPKNHPLADQDYRECLVGCMVKYNNDSWTQKCETQLCLAKCGYEEVNVTKGEGREDVWIPSQPEVALEESNPHLPYDITLVWSIKPTTSENDNSVYFTVESTASISEEWTYELQTDNKYAQLTVDICTHMSYRVAAVNKYGTKGYSEKSLTIRTDLPAPAEVAGLRQMPVVWNGKLFEMKFYWNSPQGWIDDDIMTYKVPDMVSKSCRDFAVPTPIVIINQTRDEFGRFSGVMKVSEAGRESECIYETKISAVSRCSIVGVPKYLYMNLADCLSLQNYTCVTEPPVLIPPGSVENLTMTQTFINYNEAILEWDPPENVGSTGKILQHEILWGPLETPRDLFIENEEGREIIPGNATSFLIVLNQSDVIYGFAVQAQNEPNPQLSIDIMGVMETGSVVDMNTLNDPGGNDLNNQGNESVAIYIIIAIVALIVLMISVIITLIIRRRYNTVNGKRKKKPTALGYGVMLQKQINDSLINNPYYEWNDSAHPPEDFLPDRWEIHLSLLKFGKVLGNGAFGQVLAGTLKPCQLVTEWLAISASEETECPEEGMEVAVKKLLANQSSIYRDDFLMEISLMKKLGRHPNIVSMIGCCTLGPEPCLVVEMVSHGDLLHYLRKHRTTDNDDGCLLTLKDLLSFGKQISVGMSFLSSKGFVHRDLAARNILVGDGRTVKIGDFGLTRYIYDDKVYVTRRGGKLPLKWMALESIYDLTFTTKSDVWSFGIVLYELITLGNVPYPTIDNKELLIHLRRGYRMEQPQQCTEDLYHIMCQCWHEHPRERPTFETLQSLLDNLLTDETDSNRLNICITNCCPIYFDSSSAEEGSNTLLATTSNGFERSDKDFNMSDFKRSNRSSISRRDSDNDSTCTKHTNISDGVIITLTPEMTKYEVNVDKETKWLGLPIHTLESTQTVCSDTQLSDTTLKLPTTKLSVDSGLSGVSMSTTPHSSTSEYDVNDELIPQSTSTDVFADHGSGNLRESKVSEGDSVIEEEDMNSCESLKTLIAKYEHRIAIARNLK